MLDYPLPDFIFPCRKKESGPKYKNHLVLTYYAKFSISRTEMENQTYFRLPATPFRGWHPVDE